MHRDTCWKIYVLMVCMYMFYLLKALALHQQNGNIFYLLTRFDNLVLHSKLSIYRIVESNEQIAKFEPITRDESYLPHTPVKVECH